jgi:DNA-binding response OmpR family regulator
MKTRILLVDDELAILLTLKALLEMNGFEVDTAASARGALQKMENGVFHLVITGMHMETETSGFDVIRAARQQSYAPALAILTAASCPDWKSSGAQKLFVKPVKIADLLRGIEELLDMQKER